MLGTLTGRLFVNAKGFPTFMDSGNMEARGIQLERTLGNSA